MAETNTSPRPRLTRLVLFLVHSNLVISTAAASVALSTMILADLRVDPLALGIVFAVTLFVYSFNRLTDLAEDEQNVPDRAAFVRTYGWPLLAVGVVCYVGATVVAVTRGIPGAPAMILPLFVAVLYSVVGLKRILLVKNVLVGLSWGAIPLGVGVYYGVLLTTDILFLFGFITASLTIAAVVFDIKDIAGDRMEGIRSVPVIIGPRRTRQCAIAGCLILVVVVIGAILTGIVHIQYLLLLPFLGYMIGYSLVATQDRTAIFYGFVIDTEHIWLALVLGCWQLFV